MTESLTNEQRIRIVNELPAEHKPSMQALLKTLTGTNIDDFMTTAEECLNACSMILKKIDKKKDRSIILGHKHVLLEKLEQCEDPALVLHLATLIIFEIATQTMLHCSGRHIASILSFLKQYLNQDQIHELGIYHGKYLKQFFVICKLNFCIFLLLDQVTLFLSGGEDAQNIGETLRGKMESIKKIAMDFKKPSSNEK